ncbi:MAG: tripartite tricarboxylate transporter TctB family protein, partial [Roseovarius sp.]|nr:tripartite tricarboxylate transporter TctB family protein [Roseovarius sp.]
MMGLVGLGLIATCLRLSANGAPLSIDVEDRGSAQLRMIGIAVIMLVSMVLFARVGMVWTSMLSYLATAFLVKTRHP